MTATAIPTTDSDNTVILNAVGLATGGDRAVDVIIRRGPVPSEFAILTQDALKINGNPGQVMDGVMAAHMEVTVSGNPNYQGRIIAENGYHHAGQEVLSGQLVQDLVTLNEFSGNPTHVNNGLSPWDPVAIQRLAWRERVN